MEIIVNVGSHFFYNFNKKLVREAISFSCFGLFLPPYPKEDSSVLLLIAHAVRVFLENHRITHNPMWVMRVIFPEIVNTIVSHSGSLC